MATGPSQHSLTLQLLIQEKIPGLITKIKGEFGILGSAIHLVNDLFKSFNTALMAIGKTLLFTGILAGIKLVKDIFVLNENIAVMGQRFGMSRGQIKDFNAQLFEYSKRAGIMVDQTSHMAKTLIEAGFKDRKNELAQLSATLFQFSAVTGTTAEVGAEFAAELNKMGYNVSKLLPQLASLRVSLQLSSREFESIIKLTEKAADLFYIFGNASNLDKNVAGIAKLAATMAGLQLSTEQIDEQLTALLDPRKWQESNITTLLGYGFDELWKIQTEGFGNTTQFLIDLQRRVRNFANFNNQAVMNNLILNGILTDKQARFYKQIYNMDEASIRLQGEKADTQLALNKLYQEMGDILLPLQKQWQALLSEAMPIIKDLVGYLGTIVRWLTEIAKWIKTHGGGKTLVFGLLGATGLSILIGVAKWLFAIKTTALITAAALKTAGVVGATAGAEIAGGLGIANIAGTTLLTTLGSIGMGLMYLAGAAAAVFAVWKLIELAKKTGVDYSTQMGNIFDPIMAGSNWAGAFGSKLAKSLTGTGNTSTGTTDNLSQISSQAATNKAEADARLNDLMEKLLESVQAIMGNTGTQNNLTQGLVGVIKHESAADRARRLAEEAWKGGGQD